MTSTEERLPRAYLAARGDIYGQDDDIEALASGMPAV